MSLRTPLYPLFLRVHVPINRMICACVRSALYVIVTLEIVKEEGRHCMFPCHLLTLIGNIIFFVWINAPLTVVLYTIALAKRGTLYYKSQL